MFRLKKLMMFFGILLVSQVIISGISSAVLAKDEVSDSSFIYGDVNGDKSIDAVDFAFMRQYLLEIISEFKSANGIKAADVDGNGTFNAIDFAVMRKYLLGIIDEFPANRVVTPALTPTLTPTLTLTPTSTPTSTSTFSQLIPSNIDVSISGVNSVSLSWDKVDGAALYQIYRNESMIASTDATFYNDLNVIENVDYIYSVKAVNNIGESSLNSSNIIVNTGEVIIDSNQVLSENRFYGNLKLDNGALLDINGYKMNVNGEFDQKDGTVYINAGKLSVEGNYVIEDYGNLEMTNEEDYVYVGGDFINAKTNNYISPITEYLTAGILEVKGNFSCMGQYGEFRASGSHKVVLSGEGDQIVQGESYISFNELEIKNERGVEFASEVAIQKMKGSYKVKGDLVLQQNIEAPIMGDVLIDGNLRIKGMGLDLAGYTFKVNGNLIQSNEAMKVNAGKLSVEGNYVIEDYGNLEMTNEEDYVYVGGDFINAKTNNYISPITEYLTAGILEVKGNFSCMGQYGEFRASGSHKVVLSGEGDQIVQGESYISFNELEIKNERGVEFASEVAIKKMKGNYKVKGDLVLQQNIEAPIIGDVLIDGNLRIKGMKLDLAGYTFKVNGDLIQSNEAMKINTGKLSVEGNYVIEDYGSLVMTNEEDYVYVGGDFTTDSTIDHSTCLTAGTLEVKGNFTQTCFMGNPSNFAASGTHRTILSGDSVQIITFEAPTSSSFNILKLTKPIDTGYTFIATPVWKTLEQ